MDSDDRKNEVDSSQEIYGDRYMKHLAHVAKSSLRVNLVLHGANKADVLTARELGIVQLICDYYSSKEIAQVLEISVKTVDAHRNNILRKLNLPGMIPLVRWAIRNHVIYP